jgi:hypothetical protein
LVFNVITHRRGGVFPLMWRGYVVLARLKQRNLQTAPLLLMDL